MMRKCYMSTQVEDKQRCNCVSAFVPPAPNDTFFLLQGGSLTQHCRAAKLNWPGGRRR